MKPDLEGDTVSGTRYGQEGRFLGFATSALPVSALICALGQAIFSSHPSNVCVLHTV